MAIEANIRRIAVDPVNDYNSLVNKNTGGLIYLPRGRDIALQFGVYEKTAFVQNPASYLTTVTAEVKPYTNRGGTALVTANTSTIASISEGQWQDDSSQHFTILLPNAQTISLATADETDYWLVVTAATLSGKPMTLIAGRCVGVNDGGNFNPSVPTPGDPTYVTLSQFYSAINALAIQTIRENGYQGRWGIDENGAPVWRQA